MDLIFIPIEEAIERYKKFRNLPVNNIVKNRELPILEIAKRRLNRLKNNI